MEAYDKTVWVNDETDLNEDNMNKIENQLESLTNNVITIENAGYQTASDVNTLIESAIGGALDGSY